MNVGDRVRYIGNMGQYKYKDSSIYIIEKVYNEWNILLNGFSLDYFENHKPLLKLKNVNQIYPHDLFELVK